MMKLYGSTPYLRSSRRQSWGISSCERLLPRPALPLENHPNLCERVRKSRFSVEKRNTNHEGETMTEKGSYDRTKFVEDARQYELKRLAKDQEWNKVNEVWIQQHGPIPFQEPQLLFDGK